MITKILISKNAKTDLYLHHFYKQKYSALAAEKFFKDFNSAINSLSLFPYMYPKISDNNSYRKVLFNKRYLMIYLIENDIVYIDSIINCKQNYLEY